MSTTGVSMPSLRSRAMASSPEPPGMFTSETITSWNGTVVVHQLFDALDEATTVGDHRHVPARAPQRRGQQLTQLVVVLGEQDMEHRRARICGCSTRLEHGARGYSMGRARVAHV